MAAIARPVRRAAHRHKPRDALVNGDSGRRLPTDPAGQGHDGGEPHRSWSARSRTGPPARSVRSAGTRSIQTGPAAAAVGWSRMCLPRRSTNPRPRMSPPTDATSATRRLGGQPTVARTARECEGRLPGANIGRPYRCHGGPGRPSPRRSKPSAALKGSPSAASLAILPDSSTRSDRRARGRRLGRENARGRAANPARDACTDADSNAIGERLGVGPPGQSSPDPTAP